jgi:hypothetical protein
MASINIRVSGPESDDSAGSDEFVQCSFVGPLVTALGVGKSTDAGTLRVPVTGTVGVDKSPEFRAFAFNIALIEAVVDNFCKVIHCMDGTV